MSHMRVPSIHTMKLNDRNKVIVYLGKELGTKAHRLYDFSRKENFCRDIIYEEQNRGCRRHRPVKLTVSVLGFHD